MQNSLGFLQQGTADDFVDALIGDVFEHPATHHPYLEGLSSNSLPNIDEAIRDYAFNYSVYSAEFVTYLNLVIAGLTRQHHRELIIENLYEEQGDPNSTVPEKKPHSVIFNEFKEQIGINPEYKAKATISATSLCWRDTFKEICKSQNVCVGLGAIGLGTEMIVPKIYDHFIHAIEDHSSFENSNSMFFRLHVECDDEHSDDLLTVIRDFADVASNREYLRFGAQIALDLRKTFWDVMLSRALCMKSRKKILTAA